jgi:hypothetical protein
MIRLLGCWRSSALALAAAVLTAAALAIPQSGCDRWEAAGSSAGPPRAEAAIPTDDELRRRIDAVIERDFRHRRLDIKTQAAWQVLHAVCAYGRSVVIYDLENRVVPAVDYLLKGGQMTGWKLRPGDPIEAGRQGVYAELEPGSTTGQGHKDQWLGYMAISGCGLTVEQPILVAGREFTIGDWLGQILRDVHQGTEHGWTLMVLAGYVPVDFKWTAGDGTEWSIERVMALEASRDLNDAACGGTHSLGGMVVALNKYLAAGGRYFVLEGDKKKYTTDGWGAAGEKIDRCAVLVREYQQPDGSLSGGYFQRAEHSPELANRLRTTGHTLEFLSLVLSDNELAKPWVTRAVIHMCEVLDATKNQEIECGALYHGMHGLVRYRQRRFGKLDLDRWAQEELARGPRKSEPATAADNDAAPAPTDTGSAAAKGGTP